MDIEGIAQIIYNDYRKPYWLTPEWDDTSPEIKNRYLKLALKVAEATRQIIQPKPDESRLVTEGELVKAREEARLSPFATPYQERCVIARAQLAKDIEWELAQNIGWEARTTSIKDTECPSITTTNSKGFHIWTPQDKKRVKYRDWDIVKHKKCHSLKGNNQRRREQ